MPTDSHYVNRIQSICDLDDLSSEGKEKVMPQDRAEHVARKDTPTLTQTQSIEEILELLRELREKSVQGNLRSSPQHGAGSSRQPHTNPTPDASRSSDGTLPLRPEHEIPSVSVTNVYHHYHYHYNVPNASPPPIINKNIVRINNRNASNSSDHSELGNDEGEY
jgi:hypothetical protein